MPLRDSPRKDGTKRIDFFSFQTLSERFLKNLKRLKAKNQIILVCILILLIIGIFSTFFVQHSQNTISRAAEVKKCLQFACSGKRVKSEIIHNCSELFGKKVGCNSNPECKWNDQSGECQGKAHKLWGCQVAGDEYQCNNLKKATGENVIGSCSWSCAVYETPTLPPADKYQIMVQSINVELPKIKEYLASAQKAGDQEDIKFQSARIRILETALKGTKDQKDEARDLITQIDKEREDNATARYNQMHATITPGPNSSCLPRDLPCLTGEKLKQDDAAAQALFYKVREKFYYINPHYRAELSFTRLFGELEQGPITLDGITFKFSVGGVNSADTKFIGSFIYNGHRYEGVDPWPFTLDGFFVDVKRLD